MARMSITKITIVGKTGPLDLELMFNYLAKLTKSTKCLKKKLALQNYSSGRLGILLLIVLHVSLVIM